jgi:hypothetical protein
MKIGNGAQIQDGRQNVFIVCNLQILPALLATHFVGAYME